ncbi:hypothetical protein CDAR_315391 [Caerostris darwini]|uniref:Uncharacterized protein n=1 Tax=Caerostris darwini TaxID=1538125 RepID=A0AAV4VF13_9ARAC|nr:hypothetical protein CDAR_315391 [Caerostris darwini]
MIDTANEMPSALKIPPLHLPLFCADANQKHQTDPRPRPFHASLVRMHMDDEPRKSDAGCRPEIAPGCRQASHFDRQTISVLEAVPSALE